MKATYLFIAMLFFTEMISASGIKPDYAKASSGKQINSQFGFIENKGQIIDQLW